MNLARFAHSYAKPSASEFGWAESAREGPADVDCRRTRPVPILKALSATGRMAPIAPSNNASQFKTPARRQPQQFIPLLLQQLPPGGIRTQAPPYRKPSQASTDSKYLA